MECPICFESITSNNIITTECGHSFHSSCFLKNAAINGYNCPMCRTTLADEPEDDAEEDIEDDNSEDDLSFVSEDNINDEMWDFNVEEQTLQCFRWLFQRANGEELEGDSSLIQEEHNEEQEWHEENEIIRQEMKDNIENVLSGLHKTKAVSYEDLLNAFLYKDSNSKYKNNYRFNLYSEESYKKVFGAINSISSRTW